MHTHPLRRTTRWAVQTTVAALAITTLTTAPFVPQTASALDETPIVPAQSQSAETPIVEPTITDVPLTEVEAPVTYATTRSVSEAEGDAQQTDLVEGGLAEGSDGAVAGAARVDLSTDVAVFGVTWPLGDEAPERIEHRTLDNGEWSAWEPLEIAPQHESVDEQDVTQGATEAVFLAGSDAVEVIAYAADGGAVSDLAVNLIDPSGDAPVENALDEHAEAVEVELPEIEEETAHENEYENADADGGPSETSSGIEAQEGGKGTKDDPSVTEPSVENDQDTMDSPSAQTPTADTAAASLAGTHVQTALNRTAATVQQASTSNFNLKIKTRKDWGANEKYRKKNTHADPVYQGAVVHHTAGTNNYTAGQVPSIIRGIYYYHAVTLGWGDIGYQIVVDKFGGVWEGRHGSLVKPVTGAQAYGANFETFGVSILGNFTSVGPTSKSFEASARAVAWMFDNFSIPTASGNIRVPGGDLRGRSVPRISGHYQIGSGTAWATACPGAKFIPRLPEFRTKVANYMLPALSGAMTRHSGKDRFETAAKTALAAHTTANTVYLANGMDFPDALAGGAAAGIQNAPLLLTTKGSLPSVTRSALQKLKPTRVVIVGGTGVVSASVANQVKSATKVTPTRYRGADRYATAANIAKKVAPKADTVYVASGTGFPDALTGVPIAGVEKAPMLLTSKSALPNATSQALKSIKPKRIVILGGTGAVNSSVERSLKAIAPTTRQRGADRFETSANVALAKYRGKSVDTVYISTGMAFPDALAGGPSAAKAKGPTLLTMPNSVPSSTANALKQLKPKNIVILGGVGPVTRFNEHRLNKYIVK